MQTLDVRAGHTEEECKAAEEQHRAELRSDSQADANYFFWAAGVALLGLELLPVRLNILVNTGAIDMLRLYGSVLGGPLHVLALYAVSLGWFAALIGLGFAARCGHRWAFLAGVVLYGADMIALMLTFSIWAFGVHAFFVFKWFEGQRLLKQLGEETQASSGSSLRPLCG